MTAELQTTGSCEDMLSLPDRTEGTIEAVSRSEWNKIGVVERTDCTITGTTTESSTSGMSEWVNVYSPVGIREDCAHLEHPWLAQSVVVENPFATPPPSHSSCPPVYPENSCVTVRGTGGEERKLDDIHSKEWPCNDKEHWWTPSRACRSIWELPSKTACLDHLPIVPIARRFGFTAITTSVTWECKGGEPDHCEFEYAGTTTGAFSGELLPDFIAILTVGQPEPEEEPQ